MPRGRPRKVVSALDGEKNLVDSMVAEVDNTSIEAGENNIPSMSSPDWNNYVLSHLQDDEKDERTPGVVVPKTDGLGRLVRLLIGDIVESRPIPVVTSQEYAVIMHSLTINSFDDPIGQLNYVGIGDAGLNNSDPPYSKFLPQVAHTRARGRAYKDALGLKNVVTSEELSEVAEKDVLITSAQQVGLKNLCRSLKVDVLKFVNLNGESYKRLEEVPKNEATRMLAKLQEYKRGEDEVPTEILEV